VITLLTKFTARDAEAAERFAAMLLKAKATVPSEPNNLSYEVFQADGDPTVFYCLESWRTREDADRHIARNKEAGEEESAAEFLTGPWETTTIRPLA
jgi:quinol monooxygenase YgiN